MMKKEEVLFWKVFRNLVLFKNIFSNFNIKGNYNYNQLINLDHYKFNNFSNLIEILSDNIKSNNNHQIIRNEKDIIYIISNVKKDNEINKSFYNLLFSSYSTTTTSTTITTTSPIVTTIQFKNDINYWINIMIKHSNCLALNEFIKFFKINNISQIIKNTIESSSLFSNQIKITNDKFKMYCYLKSINALPSNFNNIKNLKIDLSLLLSFDNKFKKLIKLYKRIIGDENLNVSNTLYTKDQLNTSIKQLIISEQLSNLKNIIHKYFKSIYSFLNNGRNKNEKIKKSIYYYIYFKKENIENIMLKLDYFNIDDKNWKYVLKEIEPLKKSKFVLNILKRNKEEQSLYSFCRAILKSNDIELIEILLNQVLKEQSTVITIDIKSMIQDNMKFIKKKEVLDYYFQNFREECGLFKNDNYRWCCLTKSSYNKLYKYDIELLEHYENLMKSIDRKFSFKFWYYIFSLNFIDILLFRVIIKNYSKPSDRVVYQIYFETCHESEVYEFLTESVSIGKSNLVYTFLSTFKLNTTFDLDLIIEDHNSHSCLPITSLLFKNISKNQILENIKNVINSNIYDENDDQECSNSNIQIEFTSILSNTTTSSIYYENVGPFKCIGKLDSINFTISLKLLIIHLCELGRINDILYILESLPNLLNINNFPLYFSSFNLEIFINYFIENLNNNNNEELLYTCLHIASFNGYNIIFKNLFSSSSPSSSSIFQLFISRLQCLIENSIITNNYELSNLLINNLNNYFSKNQIKKFKKKILKSKSSLKNQEIDENINKTPSKSLYNKY